MNPAIEERSSKMHKEALSLYEQDILLWVEDTLKKLKNREFEQLDLEHLIDEVESLGISQRRELFSRLNRLLEHLLKRIYVDSPDNYNGWEQTIRHQRLELKKLLQSAPSLKSLWQQNVAEAWQSSLESVREDYPNVDFPDQFPYSFDIEILLSQKFWQN